MISPAPASQPVYHVMTVHWRNPAWIELQAQRLLRHFPPGRLQRYGWLVEIDAQHERHFDFVCREPLKPHAEKLNILADFACHVAAPADRLVFIDGDAFPVADVEPVLDAALARHPLVAVQRLENDGDPQPHPCFCVTTPDLWRAVRGDWNIGGKWRNAAGEEVSDVGGRLMRRLERRGIEWLPLLRTNVRNLHPLFFGVYGNLVYHHGAAFRPPRSRADKAASADDEALREATRRNLELGREVLARLQADPGFLDSLMA